jgi:hypothetical protein
MTNDAIKAAFFRNLWRWKLDVGKPEQPIETHFDAAELWRTEWSPRFEQLQRNRLVMGAYRYGRLNAPGKARYDRIASIIERLEEYKVTGDDDLLVDTANLSMLEFEEGDHPLKHLGGAAHRRTVRRR